MIRKLQKDFTTPEQAKRLVELGVPVDSSDCYYLLEIPNRLCILNDGITISKLRLRLHMSHTMPAWSVGRLIEICLKCSTLEQRQVRFFCYGDDDEYSLIDYVVTALESGVMTNQMDFSKLED